MTPTNDLLEKLANACQATADRLDKVGQKAIDERTSLDLSTVALAFTFMAYELREQKDKVRDFSFSISEPPQPHT